MKIQKNLDKKIIALFIALFLWYYVDSESTIQKEFFGKINYLDMPPGLVTLKKPGRLRYLLKINKYFSEDETAPDVSFDVSLKNARAGINMLEVETRLSSPLPFFMELEKETDKVRVVLDKKMSKEINILPVIQNTLAPDRKIVNLRVKPSIILVEGPRTILNPIEELKTREIVITQPGRHQQEVSIEKPDNRVTVHPAMVRIYLDTAANTIEQQINLPVKIRNIPDGFAVKKIEPRQILTRFHGLFSKVKKFDFKNLFYYIDLKQIRSGGVHFFPPQLNENPEDLEISIPENTRIKVELNKRK